MPKATLTFLLPDEQEEFETACHGSDYRAVLDDFRAKFREMRKYQESVDVDGLWEYLHTLMEERRLGW